MARQSERAIGTGQKENKQVRTHTIRLVVPMYHGTLTSNRFLLQQVPIVTHFCWTLVILRMYIIADFSEDQLLKNTFSRTILKFQPRG